MTEREAREALGDVIVQMTEFMDEAVTPREIKNRLEVGMAFITARDAYRAAVRAETLREVRGVIVAMRKEAHSAAESWDTTLGSVISRLDALAHPEAK
jgi:Trp operon repressor